MFDPLLEELNANILLHGGKSLSVPHDLASCLSLNGNDIILNWLWQVPGFRRWRVTRLDAGEKLQVLNSVAYPEYSNEYPVMGIDLLWFGKTSKLVAILDFQPLIQEEEYFEKYYEGLKSLYLDFPDFNNKKMHSFDPHQYFSPWVLFCRGDLTLAQNLLPKIFTSFLKCYWQLNEYNVKSSSLSIKEVRELQIKYDIYSAKRDPAHGLFSSYFGKEWSSRFLKEFLFPFSSKEE